MTEEPVPPDEGVAFIRPEDLDTRVELERGMSGLPRVTVVLLIFLVVTFIITLAKGSLESLEGIIEIGAKDTASIRNGELWRLVTPMFLHAGFDHLIGNMMALYVLGMGCEHAFGRGRTLMIYVWTGVGASLLSCLSDTPSVGASGALFGLLGALMAAVYRNSRGLHIRDKRVGGVLLAWALYSMATGFLNPMIDNLAHLGGLLCGSLLGTITSLVILPTRPATNTPGYVAGYWMACAMLIYALVEFVPRLA